MTKQREVTVTLYRGDCLDVLKRFPAASVNCVVTSPPYWGLRDYGVAGQLGLEATPDEFIAKMVAMFREVWRVLRDDGTLWVNMGDSYAAGAIGGSKVGLRNTLQTGSPSGYHTRPKTENERARPRPLAAGLKPKDLVGIPWRLAFALQADGWCLRSDIIWHKPNPMPESVTDRPTKSHEYVFLLAKSERYYFDAKAVREKACGPPGGNIVPTKGAGQDLMRTRNGLHLAQIKARENGGFENRNIRTVWTIPTEAYKGAHFATFPRKLVRPCVMAGCPPGGMVLDPFVGSGTVGAVCVELGRDFIGIDLNAKYLTMARRRINNAQPALPGIV